MENTEMIFERRLHERFPVKQGVYALLKNGASKLGQIKNISKGGLAFMYINGGEQMHGSLLLDIFLSSHGFHLKDIPCNKISDIHVENKSPFSDFKMRHLGVQFSELNNDQSNRLDMFIQNYTISV
ncbi:MAG: PilZ domain-containing protein [Deltaproteobacteria bacterium]|jgi:hypothetical protein|nr:PilZ domain-containing protein [Deltaproteobacteria bacterium]